MSLSPSTASPRSLAGASALTVHLPDGWTLVLERRGDGRVDITLRSSNQTAAVLIGGYGQHPRVSLLDAGVEGDGVQAILEAGSCVIALPDAAAQSAVSEFLAKHLDG